MNSPVLKRVLQCSDIPRLPAVVAQLIELLGDRNAKVKAIAETLSKDADLTFNVLRMVNSSYYGLTNKVSTIEQAVTMLGLKKIKSITVGCALAGSLAPKLMRGCDPKLFWRHSLFASTSARLLAQHCRSPHTEEAFVMGLLLNIGALAMATSLDSLYTVLLDDGWQSMADLAQRERAKFNADHAAVSAAMVESWRLPEILHVPMQYTYQPDQAPEEYRPLAGLLAVASDAADVIGAAQVGEAERFFDASNAFCDHAVQRLGVDWHVADKLISDATESAGSVADLLNIDAGPMPDLEKLSEQFQIAVKPNHAA